MKSIIDNPNTCRKNFLKNIKITVISKEQNTNATNHLNAYLYSKIVTELSPPSKMAVNICCTMSANDCCDTSTVKVIPITRRKFNTKTIFSFLDKINIRHKTIIMLERKNCIRASAEIARNTPQQLK